MFQQNDKTIMISKDCKRGTQKSQNNGRKTIGEKAYICATNSSLPEVPKKLVSKSNKRSGKKDMTTIGSAEEVTLNLNIDNDEKGTKTSATASSTTLTSAFGKPAALENKKRRSTFSSEVSKDPGSVSRQTSVPIDSRERSKTRAKKNFEDE